MSGSAILLQFLNGLAGASSLFLLAAGLSLIFGVTRIVNFAHGSLYMLGMYLAVWLSESVGFWPSALTAALAVAALGAAIEMSLLRRLYPVPELLQLLATFALVLIARDFALWAWGPEDLLGPRAPGLEDAVEIAGGRFPEYDLFLIVVGPLVLAALHLLLTRTRWGILVRAATQDRDMAGALGVNQKWLFTEVFALGALLAGLGGALSVPREPANLTIDLSVLSDAFVVVVVGGLGSIPGAFLAALLIAEVKAFAIGLGFSKATLVVEFIVMAAVLVLRPWGLLGREAAPLRGPAALEPPLALPSRNVLRALLALAAALALVPLLSRGYALVLLSDVLVFALFAVSLHFITGPGGMLSFGHAAYFGLGAYGAGLLLLRAGAPMEAALVLAPLAAGIGALAFGWFCVRLSGVYLAMLTLAFAQIVWSVAFQWDAFTGGSNGLIGVWPSAWLASRTAYYYLTLGACLAGIAILWRVLYSPFGYALRASRDSPLRAGAIGIDVRAQQWAAFTLAGLAAGIAGALYAFSKGSISPETLSVPRSVDALVMVLLGGIQTLTGPAWGAALFTWLQDSASREFDYWRAVLGAVILALVLALPGGVGGLLGGRSTR
ncbi:MAG: ABC transporter permease [Betaproteobacteria bacterium RIFCSPLOWO2_12_FULL_68_20]|nr:MAG: ABC transporter permease [Betaproteobacteria bacterium RIFCSPLOWO2_12_FULL_68_20]